MSDSGSQLWTLGMSDTGDKYHLMRYDEEGNIYDPVCQVHAKNLQPIKESEVGGECRICTNCQTTKNIESIISGVSVSRYKVIFENSDLFKQNHPTS